MGTLLVFALIPRFMKSQVFRERVKVLRGHSSDTAEHDDGTVVPVREGAALRGRLLQALIVFVGVSVAGWITGLLVARRLTIGDDHSDDFQLASIMGGKKFHSHASHLKSGTAITLLGGTALDLREATLDPTGASLELRTTMGGIEVRVPHDWSVEVDQEVLAGRLEVDVTPPEELPADAPKLRIHAVTRVGGGLVTAKSA
jgi:hypothetical protein